MRNIYTLILCSVMFMSCSTDDEGIVNSDYRANNYVDTDFSTFNEKSKGGSTPVIHISNCFEDVEGSVSLDVSNGINNPIVLFSTNVVSPPDPDGTGYTVQLILQPISDCENMNSSQGLPMIVTMPYSFVNVSNIPDFRLYPSQLPQGCYKWRITIGTSKGVSPACTTQSIWYEAPLF